MFVVKIASELNEINNLFLFNTQFKFEVFKIGCMLFFFVGNPPVDPEKGKS